MQQVLLQYRFNLNLFLATKIPPHTSLDFMHLIDQWLGPWTKVVVYALICPIDTHVLTTVFFIIDRSRLIVANWKEWNSNNSWF
jgi:hypothetical protein